MIIFPRQSGKNELQAQLESYLLALLSPLDAEIVKVSPTWKPQSLNAMRRLERVLSKNIITRGLDWTKEQGYIYRVGSARIFFLSGSPTANVVGATASTLLECDEAQDVLISKWDKEIAPMAASTNATRVFWGTAWTSKTLLSREMRAAMKAQKKDGIQRVFKIDAHQVGEEVEAYKKFVAAEIEKHGRNHPFVKTQYFSEEIDAEGGIFPPARLERMQGKHQPHCHPERSEGSIYAVTIDVAGQDESATLDPGTQTDLTNQGRDSTSLTIFEIDLATLEDDLIKAPTYRSLKRHLWTGEHHTTQYAQIRDIIETWQPRYIVIDSTGVGEAHAAFLEKAYPGQVIPFKFTGKSKSDLGWSFLSVIETGRYKEHAAADDPLQAAFWQQCQNAQIEILPGPNRQMRWAVPDGTRDPTTGELVHDDLLISAALVSLLDHQEFGYAASEIVAAYDPLSEMEF